MQDYLLVPEHHSVPISPEYHYVMEEVNERCCSVKNQIIKIQTWNNGGFKSISMEAKHFSVFFILQVGTQGIIWHVGQHVTRLEITTGGKQNFKPICLSPYFARQLECPNKVFRTLLGVTEMSQKTADP